MARTSGIGRRRARRIQEAQVATRRIVKGHLVTDDLDPVTARAVEILVAADVVAAEQLLKPVAPQQRWRDLLTSRNFLTILVFATLVLMSYQQFRLADVTSGNHTTQTKLVGIANSNHHLQRQIQSCVTPDGACYRRGQRSQKHAVEQIIQSIINIACEVSYPKDTVARGRCIVLITKNLSP
jgi:hypothetical protein